MFVLKTFKTPLAIALFMTSISVGGAATAQPELTMGQENFKAQDLSLETLQIAKVQPTAFLDDASAIAMSEMKAYSDAASADQARAQRITASLPKLQAQDEGLGFAGQSTDLDIATLKYGYVLGALALLSKQEASVYTATIAQLEQVAPTMHEGLHAETVAAIKTYLAGAKQGKLDMGAYMNIMRMASQGIASAQDASGERRHGYLMVGIWSAMSVMALESGRTPASLQSIGKGLQELLTKDAAYGGSDLSIAKHIEQLNSETLSAAPNKAQAYQSIQALMQTQADS